MALHRLLALPRGLPGNQTLSHCKCSPQSGALAEAPQGSLQGLRGLARLLGLVLADLAPGGTGAAGSGCLTLSGLGSRGKRCDLRCRTGLRDQNWANF